MASSKDPKHRYYEVAEGKIDFHEQVLIDEISGFLGYSVKQQIMRAPDNNKAKYLQGGKKQSHGAEEFILQNKKGIAFDSKNFAWLAKQFREANEN